MSLQTISRENLKNVSMLELAEMILQDANQATHFKDIFAKIEEIKEYGDQEVIDRLAQFYTDLNLDGRFLTVGENMWGLKRWYPVEQIDEVITSEPKKKKKTKKKKAAKKEPEPASEEVTEPLDSTAYSDDIDELTRNLAKGDDEDDTVIPPEANTEDEDYVAELGEEDEVDEEDDDESEEDQS